MARDAASIWQPSRTMDCSNRGMCMCHVENLRFRAPNGSDWKVPAWRYHGPSNAPTDTRLDGLLLGSTLAILLTDRRVRDFIQRNFPKETPLLCGTLLILNEQWLGGRATLTNYILISLMIASTLMVHEGLVYKWLKFRPLVWIGTISYSLYIWQQLFLLHPPGNISLAVFSVAPLNIISAFAIASCSYYLIERPIIRLAHRWSNRSPANSVTDTTAGVNSSAVYPINVYEVAALPSPSLAD